MTGTGLQSDPFVVDTMGDFLTCVGTAGAYVKLGSDINVAQDPVHCIGFTAPIEISCAEVDFNNHFVRNFVVDGVGCIHGSSSSSEIKNGGFISFVHKRTATTYATIHFPGTMTNCDFKFTTQSGAFSPYCVNAGVTKNCSFNVSEGGTNNNILQDFDVFTFSSGSEENAIKYNGRFMYSGANFKALLKNLSRSYLTGSVSMFRKSSGSGNALTEIGYGLFNCCFQCSLAASSFQSRSFDGGIGLASSTGTNFFVSDLITDAYTSQKMTTSTSFLSLTSAQTKSDEHLLGIGFLP